jgi:hypothetical protein
MLLFSRDPPCPEGRQVREHPIVPGPSMLKKVQEGALSEPTAKCVPEDRLY